MGWNNWKSPNARFQQINEVPKVAGIQFFTNIDGFYNKWFLFELIDQMFIDYV